MTTRRRNLSNALHKLAEEVLVLQEREKRFSTALGESRGNALRFAYSEGEEDTVQWILKMVDMDYSVKEVADELEQYLAEKTKAPSVVRPKPVDEEDDEEEDEDD